MANMDDYNNNNNNHNADRDLLQRITLLKRRLTLSPPSKSLLSKSSKPLNGISHCDSYLSNNNERPHHDVLHHQHRHKEMNQQIMNKCPSSSSSLETNCHKARIYYDLPLALFHIDNDMVDHKEDYDDDDKFNRWFNSYSDSVDHHINNSKWSRYNNQTINQYFNVTSQWQWSSTFSQKPRIDTSNDWCNSFTLPFTRSLPGSLTSKPIVRKQKHKSASIVLPIVNGDADCYEGNGDDNDDDDEKEEMHDKMYTTHHDSYQKDKISNQNDNRHHRRKRRSQHRNKVSKDNVPFNSLAIAEIRRKVQAYLDSNPFQLDSVHQFVRGDRWMDVNHNHQQRNKVDDDGEEEEDELDFHHQENLIDELDNFNYEEEYKRLPTSPLHKFNHLESISNDLTLVGLHNHASNEFSPLSANSTTSTTTIAAAAVATTTTVTLNNDRPTCVSPDLYLNDLTDDDDDDDENNDTYNTDSRHHVNHNHHHHSVVVPDWEELSERILCVKLTNQSNYVQSITSSSVLDPKRQNCSISNDSMHSVPTPPPLPPPHQNCPQPAEVMITTTTDVVTVVTKEASSSSPITNGLRPSIQVARSVPLPPPLSPHRAFGHHKRSPLPEQSDDQQLYQNIEIASHQSTSSPYRSTPTYQQQQQKTLSMLPPPPPLPPPLPPPPPPPSLEPLDKIDVDNFLTEVARRLYHHHQCHQQQDLNLEALIPSNSPYRLLLIDLTKELIEQTYYNNDGEVVKYPLTLMQPLRTQKRPWPSLVEQFVEEVLCMVKQRLPARCNSSSSSSSSLSLLPPPLLPPPSSVVRSHKPLVAWWSGRQHGTAEQIKRVGLMATYRASRQMELVDRILYREMCDDEHRWSIFGAEIQHYRQQLLEQNKQ